MSAALEILHRVFGYPSFRGPQAEIIDRLAAGGDALVLMPTGGGKSLCYQIPALLRPGVGVVVSPLIALMQNQVDALLQAGVRAAFLNSSLDYAAAATVERRLLAGELDLIYVAPERLLMDRFLALLDRLDADGKLALFAIDEAHCVSQWGHDFRPEYIQLSVLHERFPDVPRIALLQREGERQDEERPQSCLQGASCPSHSRFLQKTASEDRMTHREIPRSVPGERRESPLRGSHRRLRAPARSRQHPAESRCLPAKRQPLDRIRVRVYVHELNNCLYSVRPDPASK